MAGLGHIQYLMLRLYHVWVSIHPGVRVLRVGRNRHHLGIGSSQDRGFNDDMLYFICNIFVFVTTIRLMDAHNVLPKLGFLSQEDMDDWLNPNPDQ